MTYRVSQKNGNPHFWQISQLPRNLEIPSWTIFNSPFNVYSKDIHFVIIATLGPTCEFQSCLKSCNLASWTTKWHNSAMGTGHPPTHLPPP